MKKVIVIAAAALLLVGGGVAAYMFFANQKSQTEDQAAQQTPVELFDKTLYSVDEPGSLWWIVNKSRPLPEGYVPAELEAPDIKLRWAASAEAMQVSSEIAPSLEAMYQAMKTAGYEVMLISGYRSAEYQAELYNRHVQQRGQASADKFSAKPGTSEHQTGMAVDLGRVDKECELEECFGDLPEGKWLADHAHEYGFIIRYPKGKEIFVGYEYEPWHLRYVGIELATELHRRQSTMEEFLL